MIRQDTPEDAYADLSNALHDGLLEGMVTMWGRNESISVRDDPAGYGAWVHGSSGGSMWLPDYAVTEMARVGFVSKGRSDRAPLPRLCEALDYGVTLGRLREL